jgi:hypothetical protein
MTADTQAKPTFIAYSIKQGDPPVAQDVTCEKCERVLKPGDELVLVVTEIGLDKQLLMNPAHTDCDEANMPDLPGL